MKNPLTCCFKRLNGTTIALDKWTNWLVDSQLCEHLNSEEGSTTSSSLVNILRSHRKMGYSNFNNFYNIVSSTISLISLITKRLLMVDGSQKDLMNT